MSKITVKTAFKRGPQYITASYQFPFEGNTYIVDVIGSKMPGTDNYSIDFDFKTEEKGFDLIAVSEPFKLSDNISTVLDMFIDALQKDAVESNYAITRIKQHYLLEPGETKNSRQIFFDRIFRKVLSKHNIEYVAVTGKPRFGDGIETIYQFTQAFPK